MRRNGRAWSTFEVTVVDEDGTRRYSFNHPVVLVGNLNKCHVQVSDPMFDNRILALCAFREVVIPIEFDSLTDSGNQSSVQRVAPPSFVRPDGSGMRLHDLGLTAELKMLDGRIAPVTEIVAAQKNLKTDRYGVRFINGHSVSHNNQQKYLRDRVTLMGRGELSHVKFRDPALHNVQCSVVRQNDHFLVTNLHNDDLVLVNDRAEEQMELNPGDVLRVGKFQMEMFQNQETALQKHPATPAVLSKGNVSNDEEIARYLSELLESGVVAPLMAKQQTESTFPREELIDAFSTALAPLADAINRLAQSQAQVVDDNAKQQQLLERLLTQLNSRQQEAAVQEHQRWQLLTNEIRQLRERMLVVQPLTGPPSQGQSLPAPLEDTDAPTPRMQHSEADVAKHKDLEKHLFALEKERKRSFRRLLQLITGKRR